MRKTGMKRRLRMYEEAANSIRLAQICMNNELMLDAISKIISISRRFEKEDYPGE